MMKKILFILLYFALIINAKTQVNIAVDLNQQGTRMSNDLIGAFFEDINYGADGGLYAELVQNRSFEYYAVSGYTSEGPLAHWSLVENGGLFASYDVISEKPLNSNNTNYLRLTISNVDHGLKGKVGVGTWDTQASFDSVKVVSGSKVWFDDIFTDAFNWNVIDGTFDVSDGTYVQSGSDMPAWSIANVEIDTSSYVFSVKAMKTGGNEGFLFPFAYIDNNNYYWVNIGGWGNSRHAIEKTENGSKTILASVDGSISTDVWYTFTMVITDSICKFYMDEALLFEINIAPSDNNSGNESFAGFKNTGFFGMAVESNKKYNFSAYLKSDVSFTGNVRICLHDENGTIIASDTIKSITTEWQKYSLDLTPSVGATDAYLSLLFNQTGVVYADMISLFPQETFKNRENGLRKDLAQTIADLKPKFLRFPGGCISHGRGLDNAYRWKESVGDVAERTPNWNLWNYHQTYGLGFYEYFLYCEDIGAKPLPVIPIGISCQFRNREIEPIENMGPWIEDAVDLVEFANGDVSTEWGSVRAAMGHPEPFNMEYICLGNEEDDIPEFRTRFIMFRDTLKKYHPEIKIIGTSGTDDTGGYYTSLWEFSKQQNLDAVDEHYYNSPQWFLNNNHRYDNFDRNGPKVFIGEYASQDDRLYNAICEAAYLTGVERNADVIQFTCYAPLLNYIEDIPYHWHPDMILFNNTSVAKTANYYVQQLYGINDGDEYLPSSIIYDKSISETLGLSGQIGVGTWNTQASFDNVKVTSGNKVWIDDDFSAGSTNWVVQDGTFTVTSNQYNQSAASQPAWSINQTVVDTSVYTITLNAMKTDGNEGFLIPFAYQDPQNYYWLNIGGWNNSQHALEKCTNGAKAPIATIAGTINNNEWYTIKIEVTQTYSKCYLNDNLLFEVAGPTGPVTASVTKDDETNDLILKMVNSSSTAIEAALNITGDTFSGNAGLTVLTGAVDARNTIDNPDVIVPVESTINVSNQFSYQLPAYSMNVIRFNLGTTSISEKSFETDNSKMTQLQISPNPAIDYAHVSMKNMGGNCTAILFDMNGNKVRNYSHITGTSLVIERGVLPAGTYLVKVIGDNGTSIGKIIFIN
ncbi:MAG: T9SS type A sorting domain-containing protein [Marinilabiliaceae bacterium]|nr:T9SS type A sorting domain-containing protein [Marinilabiliaceae bacterium]